MLDVYNELIQSLCLPDATSTMQQGQFSLMRPLLWSLVFLFNFSALKLMSLHIV